MIKILKALRAWPDTEPSRSFCSKCGWYHTGAPCGR